MVPRYPTLSGRQVVKILVKHFGFTVSRQRGSHIVLTKQSGGRKVVTIVPDHKEVQRGTVRGLLRLAEVKEADFFKEHEKTQHRTFSL